MLSAMHWVTSLKRMAPTAMGRVPRSFLSRAMRCAPNTNGRRGAGEKFGSLMSLSTGSASAWCVHGDSLCRWLSPRQPGASAARREGRAPKHSAGELLRQLRVLVNPMTRGQLDAAWLGGDEKAPGKRSCTGCSVCHHRGQHLGGCPRWLPACASEVTRRALSCNEETSPLVAREWDRSSSGSSARLGQ